MTRIFATLLSIFLCLSAGAQTDTLSSADQALLDSILANDPFLEMLKQKDRNYLDISAGIGNGSFSTRNKAANATGVADQLIFTPAVAYHFKSGFSVGLTGFITNDSNKRMELYQTGLSFSFDHIGKKVYTGISYTRYLSDLKKYNSKSLYQNDIYGYVKKASGLLQPGLALGFANGKYKAVETILIRDTATGIFFPVKDSTNNTSSYFSASASLSHEFGFYNIFSNRDQLDCTPSLHINAGSDQLVYTHTNKALERFPRLARKKFGENNGFQLQSVAASLDIMYSIGKFYIQPNLYIDYYLPATTAKRISTIYSIVAGFSL